MDAAGTELRACKVLKNSGLGLSLGCSKFGKFT